MLYITIRGGDIINNCLLKYEDVFAFIIIKHFDILKSIIECITNMKIHVLDLKNTKQIKTNLTSRAQNLDFLLKNNNQYINIEVNTKFDNSIKKRNLLYACRVCLDNAEKGNIYDMNISVIQINFNFDTAKRDLGGVYSLINPINNKELTDILKIYEINIANYVKKYYNGDKEFIEKYKYIIMLGLPRNELEKLKEGDSVVEDFIKYLDSFSNPDEQDNWIPADVEKKMYEEYITKEATKKGLRKGIRQGIAKGIDRGIERGIEQGIKTIAKKMLATNFSIDMIMQLTGLTKQQITDLQN